MNIDYSLMYVTDDRIKDDSLYYSILEESLKGGVQIVQLRDKILNSKLFYKRALKVKKICNKYNIPFIINDRLDIALAVNADGIHIGQNDIPYSIARKLLGKNKIIGLSVSNKNQAIKADKLEVDYLGISPLFSTKTKTKDLDAPLGLNGLKEIRKLTNKPLISIGGIDLNNTAEIIKSGSNGIAVVSVISNSENPQLISEKLKKTICQIGTIQ
jgi:thiamine-phosphate pyrophosphorylase